MVSTASASPTFMPERRLTHGGFYGHFASKDDLAAEACARALEKSVTRWNALRETEGDPLAVIVGSYLAENASRPPGTVVWWQRWDRMSRGKGGACDRR